MLKYFLIIQSGTELKYKDLKSDENVKYHDIGDDNRPE